MPGTFEIYKDKKGEFRFRLKSSNGQIVACGESYPTMAQATKGVEASSGRRPGRRLSRRTTRALVATRRGCGTNVAHAQRNQ